MGPGGLVRAGGLVGPGDLVGAEDPVGPGDPVLTSGQRGWDFGRMGGQGRGPALAANGGAQERLVVVPLHCVASSTRSDEQPNA